ncbi:MAG: hypothetical protein ACRDPC_10570 [Solirubrobacteraceae bacterium]
MAPELEIGRELVLEALKDIVVFPIRRNVSGTYRNATPAGSGTILELRVDVDGRRPQQRLSGDLYFHFHFCGPITLYTRSFVVEDLTIDSAADEITISGPVIYYNDPTNTSDSIRVEIPRVSIFAPAPAACVHWLTLGKIVATYACPKISEYFRTATLEIDRFQGTAFPADMDPDVDPSPTGLPASVGIRNVFQRSGIDLTVEQDDLLNDPDSGDPGDNWSEAELHDLMEARFDRFANTLQWSTYGVIVPRFGDPNYNSGYYGTMFDWGGWQTGDTYFRQGCALAEEATRGRESGTLYDSSDKKARLVLETFIHEVGHSFNLPHSWQRGTNADSASESFMNYPWGYTGGAGGETAFWENFRWEFDDVELIWMRHADRNDVIFGGRDWIGNNLSAYSRAAIERPGGALELSVSSAEVSDFGVPVTLQLALTNTSSAPLSVVVDQLQPEDGLTRVFIERPNGDIVEFVPPVLRHKAPPEPAELAPGEAAYESILLSFGAKGHQFADPGEYLIRVLVPCFPFGYVVGRAHRIRIAAPATRASEDLAHLLTGYEASKFLYFGGSRRYPELTGRLEEATGRYADSDPIAVRHIQYALGRDAARRHKRVEVKKGRRVVVGEDPDLKRAVELLDAARAPVKAREGHALDALTLTDAATRLAACHLELGQNAKAATVLEQTAKDLKARSAPAPAVERITRELAEVKKAKRRASRRKA